MSGNGWIATRVLSDGRFVGVYPLTYGRARLGVGPSEACGYFTDEW